MGKQVALTAAHSGTLFTAPSATSTTKVVVARPLPMTTFIGWSRPAGGRPSASP